jgi:hypothetical protein
MAMSCDDLVRDDIEILSYVLGLGRGIRDIVVDTHDAAMKTSDRTFSLVGAGVPKKELPVTGLHSQIGR